VGGLEGQPFIDLIW